MKKFLLSVILSVFVMATTVSAGESHGNWYVGGGQTTLGLESNPSIEIGAGNKYYFSTGIMIGGEFGIGATTVLDTYSEDVILGNLNSNLKIGYSFGNESGKGLGIIATYGFYYGMYSSSHTSSVTGNEVTDIISVQGMGPGAQIEYIFDNGLALGLTYQNLTPSGDISSETDFETYSLRIGYQW